jgi:hypothetical protein
VRAALALAGVALVSLAGCAAAPTRPLARHSAAPAQTLGTPRVTPPAAPSRSPRPPMSLPVAPGAGALPQTHASPVARGPVFRAAMTDLWRAVTSGRPTVALPAFFPVAAYRQVKAIPDPAADWRDRLWADFVLDVRAAHRLLAAGGGPAALVSVVVPAAEASWIPPGYCYNSIGYWHVPGARVVYRQRGQVRSFGIASLISWRGVWYVVHFGAVLRATATGVVDDPTTGPGVPGPPGGC